MLKANAPTKFTIPFATSSTMRNAVPTTAPPTPTSPALAAYNTGFPNVTMEAAGAGGVPPFGQDFNGLFYDSSKAELWLQAGFMYAYDATWATNSNVNGYPAQALLSRADGLGLWFNVTDGNTTNPDATGSSGWIAVRANAGMSTIAVAAGTTTPDPSVLGPKVLNITGSLTGNATLVLPLTQQGAEWTVNNNTSGAYTLTVQGATGSGVTVAQGSASLIFTDGTNFYTSTFNGAGLYLPINGTAVAATKLATARSITFTGSVTGTFNFDGSANVSTALTIGAGAVTLANMANLTANSLLGNPTSSAATPQAITLTNGLTFSGTALGMGAITPTSISTGAGVFSGFLSTSAGLGPCTGANGTTGLTGQGGYMGWNRQATFFGTTFNGEQDFVNNHGGGSGGWGFFDTGNGTTFTCYAFIRATGQIYLTPTAVNPGNGIASMAVAVSGSYGGGIGLLDGTYAWGIYDTSGTLAFSSGTGATGGLTARMTLSAAGALTAGTANFTASDKRLKKNIVKVEPQPLHRDIDLVEFDLIHANLHSRSVIAQSVLAKQKLYVNNIPKSMNADPKDQTQYFGVDRPGLGLEIAMWAAHGVDEILRRLKAAGI
jgi:hypothetical protein